MPADDQVSAAGRAEDAVVEEAWSAYLRTINGFMSDTYVRDAFAAGYAAALARASTAAETERAAAMEALLREIMSDLVATLARSPLALDQADYTSRIAVLLASAS
jgi:hypothetical protein